MSEAAAKPLPSRQRLRRLRAYPLVQYVLLQALIAVICVVALQHPLPEPPARYGVTAVDAREVTLPNFARARSPADDQPVYGGQFTWQGQDPQHAWSVFVPRFTNAVEVAVNGVVVLDSHRDPAATRPDRNAGRRD